MKEQSPIDKNNSSQASRIGGKTYLKFQIDFPSGSGIPALFVG